jgi:hypothetical protein
VGATDEFAVLLSRKNRASSHHKPGQDGGHSCP